MSFHFFIFVYNTIISYTFSYILLFKKIIMYQKIRKLENCLVTIFDKPVQGVLQNFEGF